MPLLPAPTPLTDISPISFLDTPMIYGLVGALAVVIVALLIGFIVYRRFHGDAQYSRLPFNGDDEGEHFISSREVQSFASPTSRKKTLA